MVSKGKQNKLKPLEDDLKATRNKYIMLLALIMKKTDPFDKLPKDHQMYLHHDQNNAYKRINFETKQELDKETDKYAKVKEELDELAKRRVKPVVNKAQVPFE